MTNICSCPYDNNFGLIEITNAQCFKDSQDSFLTDPLRGSLIHLQS